MSLFLSSACLHNLIRLPLESWHACLCLATERQPPHTHAHTPPHTHHKARWACVPPSPDKLSLGPQINIQAKPWLCIIELWCQECATGATLDAVTMHTHTRACPPPHTHMPTHTHLVPSCVYPVYCLGTSHPYRITILCAPNKVLLLTFVFLSFICVMCK